MDEILLAYGNRVSLGVLSGGGAVATMPLINLQDRQLGVKWRTPDLSPDSSKFYFSMPPKNLVKVAALANHSLSLDAQHRLRYSYTDATLNTFDYDTGWIDVWPAVYTTYELEFEEDNWWSGKYLEEDLVGYTHTLSVILPDAARPLYWRWEFSDMNNADGFVEAGRLFFAKAWQPIFNANFGATLGWQTGTDVQEAISGAEFFDVKTPFRVAQFKLDVMTEDEGLTGPFEIMRKMGVDGEILFMWDPTDTIHATRRQFLGRLRTLSPLEFPEGFINGAFRTSVPMEVKELVG